MRADVLFLCLLVVAFCKNGSFREENGQRRWKHSKDTKSWQHWDWNKKSNVGGATEEIADRGCVDSAATQDTTEVRPEELSEGQFMDVSEGVIKRVKESQRKWRGQKLHIKGTLGDIYDIRSAKDKIQT